MDDRLQKFLAVVERGGFTKAAAYLHVSQPALSVSLHKLEKEYKTPLITTNGRQGIELTEAGRLLYAASIEHRGVDHQLKTQLELLKEEKIQLRIGLIDSVAALLCDQEEPLRLLEQQTALSLTVANSASLRESIQANELDLAVVVANDLEDEQLQNVADGIEHLVLVCRADKAKDFQTLFDSGERLPFISYMPKSMTYRVIESALANDHIQTMPMLYSTSPDVMVRMVLRGRAMTVLPESLVYDMIARHEMAYLYRNAKPYRITRRLRLIALQGRHLPPRLAHLAAMVREQLKAYTIAHL